MSMSITTWFCVPEFGMKDMEVLCRGSAFLVRTKAWKADPNMKPNFHVLTASHVVAPWRWPKLFPEEYLRHVNEKHTHYTVEMRYPDGLMFCQGDMHPRVFHHGHRDMASLYIGPETEIVEHYSENGLEIGLDLLSDKSPKYPLQVGQELHFHGHDVVAAPPSETRIWTENEEIPIEMRDESTYDRRVVPTMFKGKLQGRTANQVFSTTLPFILPVGMCGGPVLIPRGQFTHMASDELAKIQAAAQVSPSGGRKRPSGVSPELSKPHIMRKETIKAAAAENKINIDPIENVSKNVDAGQEEMAYRPGKSEHLVVGLLEGIVPVDHAVEEIRGSPVFVESTDIIKFLDEVEAGNIEPVVGGEGAEFVGRDQDPEKMNYKFI